jgi:hypothetical protein
MQGDLINLVQRWLGEADGETPKPEEVANALAQQPLWARGTTQPVGDGKLVVNATFAKTTTDELILTCYVTEQAAASAKEEGADDEGALFECIGNWVLLLATQMKFHFELSDGQHDVLITYEQLLHLRTVLDLAQVTDAPTQRDPATLANVEPFRAGVYKLCQLNGDVRRCWVYYLAMGAGCDTVVVAMDAPSLEPYRETIEQFAHACLPPGISLWYLSHHELKQRLPLDVPDLPPYYCASHKGFWNGLRRLWRKPPLIVLDVQLT